MSEIVELSVENCTLSNILRTTYLVRNGIGGRLLVVILDECKGRKLGHGGLLSLDEVEVHDLAIL